MHEPPRESSGYEEAAALPKLPKWVLIILSLIFDKTLTVLGPDIISDDTIGSSWGYIDGLKYLF